MDNDYNLTPEQRKALQAYLRTAVMPLIEAVLIKKLGQALLFIREELEGKNAQSSKG